MGLFRKYRLYKRILIISFAINTFFILTGIASLVFYFRSHEPDLLVIALVSLGTLIFGIVIPLWLLSKLSIAADEARLSTEKLIASWTAKWMTSSTSQMDNPQFWLDSILMGVELLSGEIDHPAGKFISGFAPLVRDEIKEQPKKKAK